MRSSSNSVTSLRILALACALAFLGVLVVSRLPARQPTGWIS